MSLGVLLVLLSHRPLWHTDLWGHLVYGRWIRTEGRLPSSDPLMTLSDGNPMVDTAWLSQLFGESLWRAGGNAALQTAYAAGITLGTALLLVACRDRSRRTPARLLAAAMFLWTGWSQLEIIRPQIAGLVCCTGMLALVGWRGPHRRTRLVGIALVFVSWANLHGSFPVGLFVLAVLAIGRAIDVLRRTPRPAAVIGDPLLRDRLRLLVIASLAVLVNPYGPRLIVAVLEISRHPNLADLVEWQPIHLGQAQGRRLLTAAILMTIVLGSSPRRTRAEEWLLPLLLGLGTLVASRLMAWWAPLAAWSLAGPAGAWLDRLGSVTGPAPRRSLWTAVALGSFAAAVLATPVLAGRVLPTAAAVSDETPVRAVEWLKQNPDGERRMFNVYEWGDYLAWAGPPRRRVFVASHSHHVPVHVWRDYLHILGAGTGWQRKLDRYRVLTILLDHQRYPTLDRELKSQGRWTERYRDDRAVIWTGAALPPLSPDRPRRDPRPGNGR